MRVEAAGAFYRPFFLWWMAGGLSAACCRVTDDRSTSDHGTQALSAPSAATVQARGDGGDVQRASIIRRASTLSSEILPGPYTNNTSSMNPQRM